MSKEFSVADVRKVFDKITKEMAEELTAAIEDAYESAIAMFYYHYTPTVYDRTYSTFLASDHYNGYNNVLKSSLKAGKAAIKFFKHDNLDKIINGADRVLSGSSYSLYGGAMPVNHRKRIKVERSGRGYIAGITVSADNIPGNPYYNHWGNDDDEKFEPMDTEWVFNRTFEEGIHGFTTKEIPKRLKGYRRMGDNVFIRPWVPRKLNPSPYYRVNSTYKKLTTKGNLSKMVARYLNKYADALNHI